MAEPPERSAPSPPNALVFINHHLPPVDDDRSGAQFNFLGCASTTQWLCLGCRPFLKSNSELRAFDSGRGRQLAHQNQKRWVVQNGLGQSDLLEPLGQRVNGLAHNRLQVNPLDCIVHTATAGTQESPSLCDKQKVPHRHIWIGRKPPAGNLFGASLEGITSSATPAN